MLRHLRAAAGYRQLNHGEKIQEGDEAFTWTNPECTRKGWAPVDSCSVGDTVGPGVVPIRRRTDVGPSRPKLFRWLRAAARTPVEIFARVLGYPVLEQRLREAEARERTAQEDLRQSEALVLGLRNQLGLIRDILDGAHAAPDAVSAARMGAALIQQLIGRWKDAAARAAECDRLRAQALGLRTAIADALRTLPEPDPEVGCTPSDWAAVDRAEALLREALPAHSATAEDSASV